MVDTIRLRQAWSVLRGRPATVAVVSVDTALRMMVDLSEMEGNLAVAKRLVCSMAASVPVDRLPKDERDFLNQTLHEWGSV